ncbi:protein cup-like [Anopheles aquasalis]|uniref:protein cup-like n=1 Tax=Anopheles aquasalis TaxID=42839 RepID=UPI00215A45EA|nr:protein cup-like [Anopheles aquasalis]
MVKFVTPDNSTMTSSLRHTEQYDNCSGLLIESDATPLEELDPAILSCGLPAIVLDVGETLNLSSSDVPTIIRYTVAQLLALRKAPFSHRRPAAIDDPCTGGYPIWQRNGFRRAAGSDEELYGGSAAGRKPNDRHRDNGLVPRFRRNHEFSNRNHHVIVKSYSGGDGGISGHQMRLQDTIIEEEPEWVVAGPTSRLDTIELRGFDDDMMRNMTDSLKATSYPVAAGGGGSGTQNQAAHTKRSDFYDELLHYEHVHQKQQQQPGGGKHDTSGSGGDGESVSTSNNGNSPPPARSTPTKHVTDQNNNNHGKPGAMAGGRGGSSASGSGYSTDVNVSNFEEFMKFDSILGDSSDTESSSFNKFLRRTSSFTGSGSGGQQHHLNQQQHHHHHQHQQQQHSHHHGSHHQQHHVRFALDRNTNHYQRPAGSGRLSMSSLQHPPLGLDVGSDSYDSQAPPPVGGHRSAGNEPVGAKPFQRLVEMMAVQSQRVQHQQQQQYLMQLLQNNQQTESLRQMLMKNASLDGRQQGRQQQHQHQHQQHQQHQGQRVPTQRELQLHTQSIMKNALLRKKIVEQGRIILEQQQQGPQEPIPAVQQLIQSIYPNVQRSLAVLASNNSANQQQQQHSGSFSGEMRNEAASFSAGNSGGRRGLVRSSSAPSNRRPPF